MLVTKDADSSARLHFASTLGGCRLLSLGLVSFHISSIFAAIIIIIFSLYYESLLRGVYIFYSHYHARALVCVCIPVVLSAASVLPFVPPACRGALGGAGRDRPGLGLASASGSSCGSSCVWMFTCKYTSVCVFGRRRAGFLERGREKR